MKYPLSHIQKLRRAVIKNDLFRPPEFDALTDTQLQFIYNGIGSDKYGDVVVGITTSMLSLYEPPALIHDVWWGFLNTGSQGMFCQSNSEFGQNCRTMATRCRLWFGWFRPEQRRCLLEIASGLARVVSSPIGWRIWQSNCHKETMDPVAGAL